MPGMLASLLPSWRSLANYNQEWNMAALDKFG
jgi:hypothetical protein